MSHLTQLTAIHQQISITKQAFKKNKQNISKLSNHQCMIKSNADLKDIKNILKDNLRNLNTNKTSSSQSYECIIKQLKLLLKQAWTKNQFLMRDRAQVLMQNNRLKQALQCMRQQLQSHKKQLNDLRLNGYSNGHTTGVYANGNIFNTVELVSHIISHNRQQYYRVDTMIYDDQKKFFINRQLLTNNHQQKHLQDSSGKCSSEQESMLLRQISQEGLVMSVGGNNSCNNSNQQQQRSLDTNSNNNNNSPSQIMQTPNYNFKQTNFGLNNIKMIPGHFIDIGSQFISKANSCEASRNRQDGLNSINEGDNNLVEISLSNMNNNELYLPMGAKKQEGRVDNDEAILPMEQHITSYNIPTSSPSPQLSPTNPLYLPINQNKITLKQQIQTFKQHLNNFGSYFPQSEQQNKTKQQQNHQQQQQKMQRQQNDNNNSSQYITKTEQCRVVCSSSCQQGIFRAFYMSLLRFPLYRQKILSLLQQLSHDQSFTLYKPYPKNQFWVDLITAFLQMVNIQKQTPLCILEHLNRFKLIDTLIIQAMKYRVEYLYNEEIGLEEAAGEEGLINNGSSNNYDNDDVMQMQISNSNNNNKNAMLSLTSSPQPHLPHYSNPSRLVFIQNTVKQPQHFSQSSSTTTSHRQIQIFNALASNFDLSFNYSSNRCYQFYRTIQGEECHQLEVQMMFVIENVLSQREGNSGGDNFVFDFSLYYQKSQENTMQGEEEERRQLDEYQYSVKRQFEDINIAQRVNTKRRNGRGMNESSNLLNSGEYFYNQDSGTSSSHHPNPNFSSNGHNSHQPQGSFISQTNQYPEEQQDYFTQDISQTTFPYINHNLHQQQQQIMSENISYRWNNETTMMRGSQNQECEEIVYERRELRERMCNYEMNESLLEEEPSVTKRRNILLGSNNSSNFIPSNPTKQLTHALSHNIVNFSNNLKNKQNQKYYSGNSNNLNSQNFIMKKICNTQLNYDYDDDDSPIQASPSYYYDESIDDGIESNYKL